MKRRLPSLSALECFEAVMNDRHVTRAAEGLNLSQSAVSRQIKNLEDFVRQPLFRRERKRLIPTDAANQFAAAVGPLLAELEAQTLKMITWGAYDKVLTLGLLPTFGSRWLIPRLSGFTATRPDIQINIVTGLTHTDFVAANTDVAVQYGDGNWPGYTAHLLQEETIIAVVSPELAGSAESADIENFDRLTMRTRPTAWGEWQGREGDTKTPQPPGTQATGSQTTGTQFENFTMMIEAVRAGLGVAVLPEMYVRDDITSGRLVAPFGEPMRSRGAYYLTYPDHLVETEKVSAFRDWLLGEAAKKKQERQK